MLFQAQRDSARRACRGLDSGPRTRRNQAAAIPEHPGRARVPRTGIVRDGGAWPRTRSQYRLSDPMTRDHHKWFSRSLNRDMELLVFGHGGPPMIVFPTSMGAFFEYEDRGMIGALAGKLEHGALQLYCVSSVDSESWYNRHVHPRQRVRRHLH